MREKKWVDGKPYDPNGFDSIAEEIYKPCYSMIGQQIMRRTGISGGDCADIGSGGGHLGIALQSMGNFRVTFVDILPEAIEIARKRSDSLGFAEKNSFAVGRRSFASVYGKLVRPRREPRLALVLGRSPRGPALALRYLEAGRRASMSAADSATRKFPG